MNFRHLQKLSVLCNYNTLYRTARSPRPSHKSRSTDVSPTDSNSPPCVPKYFRPRSLAAPQSLEPCSTIKSAFRTSSAPQILHLAVAKQSSGTKNVSKLMRSFRESMKNVRAFKIKSEKLFARNETKKINRASYTTISSRRTPDKRSKANKQTEEVKLKKILSVVLKTSHNKYDEDQGSHEGYGKIILPHVECMIKQHMRTNDKVSGKGPPSLSPKNILTIDGPLNNPRRYYSSNRNEIPKGSKDRPRNPSDTKSKSKVFPPPVKKSHIPPANDPGEPLVASKVCPEPPCVDEPQGLPYFYRRHEVQGEDGVSVKDEVQRVYFTYPHKIIKIENVSIKQNPGPESPPPISKQIADDINAINRNLLQKPNYPFPKKGAHVQYVREVVTTTVENISEEEYLKNVRFSPQQHLKDDIETRLKNIRGASNKQHNVTIEYKRKISTTSVKNAKKEEITPDQSIKAAPKMEEIKQDIVIPTSIYHMKSQKEKSEKKQKLTVLETPKKEQMKIEIPTATTSHFKSFECDLNYCEKVSKELEAKFNLEDTPVVKKLENKMKTVNKQPNVYFKDQKPSNKKLNKDFIPYKLETKQDKPKKTKPPWEMSLFDLGNKIFSRFMSPSKVIETKKISSITHSISNDSVEHPDSIKQNITTRKNEKIECKFPSKVLYNEFNYVSPRSCEPTSKHKCKKSKNKCKKKKKDPWKKKKLKCIESYSNLEAENANSVNDNISYMERLGHPGTTKGRMTYKKNILVKNITKDAIRKEIIPMSNSSKFNEIYPLKSFDVTNESNNAQDMFENNSCDNVTKNNHWQFDGSLCQKQFEDAFYRTYIQDKSITSAFSKTMQSFENREMDAIDAWNEDLEKTNLQPIVAKETTEWVNDEDLAKTVKLNMILSSSNTEENLPYKLPRIDYSKKTEQKPIGIVNITLKVPPVKKEMLEPFILKQIRPDIHKILRFEEYKKQLLDLETKKCLGSVTIWLTPFKKLHTSRNELSKAEKICKEELLALQSRKVLDQISTSGSLFEPTHKDREKANFSKYLEQSQNSENINKALFKNNFKQYPMQSSAKKPDGDSSNEPKKVLTIIDKIWAQVKIEAKKTMEEMEKSKTTAITQNRLFVDAQTKQLNSITNLQSKALKHLEENYKHSTKDLLEMKKAEIKSMVEEEVSGSSAKNENSIKIIIQSEKKSPPLLKGNLSHSKYIIREVRSTPKLEALNEQRSVPYSSSADKKEDPFGRCKPDPYLKKQKKMCPDMKPIDLRANMKASDCDKCVPPTPAGANACTPTPCVKDVCDMVNYEPPPRPFCPNPCPSTCPSKCKKKPTSPCCPKPDPCKKKSASPCCPKPDPCKKKPTSPCCPKPDPCKKKSTSSCCPKPDPCKPDPCKPDPCKKSSCCPKPDPCKPDPCKPDPCKKKSTSSCCPKPDPCKPDPCKPDPCKKKSTSSCCPKPDPCKPDPCKPDPCKKKSTSSCCPKPDPCKPDPCKPSPCKKKTKKKDPCKCLPKKTSVKKGVKHCSGNRLGPKKSRSPCKAKKKSGCDPCARFKKKNKNKKKKDPCKKPSPCKLKKKPSPCSPCKKKPSPCKKKPSPCKKKPSPCSPCKKKPSPCKKKPSPCKKKPSPCKKKPSPCKKKPSPCKKKPSPSKKHDPCAEYKNKNKNKKKPSPCKKTTPPKSKKKPSPCSPGKKKPSPCKKKASPCSVSKKKPSAGKARPGPSCPSKKKLSPVIKKPSSGKKSICSKDCFLSKLQDRLKCLMKGPNTKNKIQVQADDPCKLPKNKEKELRQKSSKSSTCSAKSSKDKVVKTASKCKIGKSKEKKKTVSKLPAPSCKKDKSKETDPGKKCSKKKSVSTYKTHKSRESVPAKKCSTSKLLMPTSKVARATKSDSEMTCKTSSTNMSTCKSSESDKSRKSPNCCSKIEKRSVSKLPGPTSKADIAKETVAENKCCKDESAKKSGIKIVCTASTSKISKCESSESAEDTDEKTKRPTFGRYKPGPKIVTQTCCKRHSREWMIDKMPKVPVAPAVKKTKVKRTILPSPKCSSSSEKTKSKKFKCPSICCKKRGANAEVTLLPGSPPVCGKIVISTTLEREPPECDPVTGKRIIKKVKVTKGMTLPPPSDCKNIPKKKGSSTSTSAKSFSTKSASKTDSCKKKSDTKCMPDCKCKPECKCDEKPPVIKCKQKKIPFDSPKCHPTPKVPIIPPCPPQPKVAPADNAYALRMKKCKTNPNLYTRDDVRRCQTPFQPPRIFRVQNFQFTILGPKVTKDNFSKICRKNPCLPSEEHKQKKIVCNDCVKCLQAKQQEVTEEYIQKVEEMIETKQCLSHYAMQHVPHVPPKIQSHYPRYLEILKRLQSQPSSSEHYITYKKRGGNSSKSACCNPRGKSACDP